MDQLDVWQHIASLLPRTLSGTMDGMALCCVCKLFRQVIVASPQLARGGVCRIGEQLNIMSQWQSSLSRMMATTTPRAGARGVPVVGCGSAMVDVGCLFHALDEALLSSGRTDAGDILRGDTLQRYNRLVKARGALYCPMHGMLWFQGSHGFWCVVDDSRAEICDVMERLFLGEAIPREELRRIVHMMIDGASWVQIEIVDRTLPRRRHSARRCHELTHAMLHHVTRSPPQTVSKLLHLELRALNLVDASTVFAACAALSSLESMDLSLNALARLGVAGVTLPASLRVLCINHNRRLWNIECAIDFGALLEVHSLDLVVDAHLKHYETAPIDAVGVTLQLTREERISLQMHTRGSISALGVVVLNVWQRKRRWCAKPTPVEADATRKSLCASLEFACQVRMLMPVLEVLVCGGSKVAHCAVAEGALPTFVTPPSDAVSSTPPASDATDDPPGTPITTVGVRLRLREQDQALYQEETGEGECATDGDLGDGCVALSVERVGWVPLRGNGAAFANIRREQNRHKWLFAARACPTCGAVWAAASITQSQFETYTSTCRRRVRACRARGVYVEMTMGRRHLKKGGRAIT